MTDHAPSLNAFASTCTALSTSSSANRNRQPPAARCAAYGTAAHEEVPDGLLIFCTTTMAALIVPYRTDGEREAVKTRLALVNACAMRPSRACGGTSTYTAARTLQRARLWHTAHRGANRGPRGSRSASMPCAPVRTLAACETVNRRRSKALRLRAPSSRAGAHRDGAPAAPDAASPSCPPRVGCRRCGGGSLCGLRTLRGGPSMTTPFVGCGPGGTRTGWRGRRNERARKGYVDP